MVFHLSEDLLGERLALHSYPYRAVCIGTRSSKSGIQNDAFCVCLKGDKWILVNTHAKA